MKDRAFWRGLFVLAVFTLPLLGVAAWGELAVFDADMSASEVIAFAFALSLALLLWLFGLSLSRLWRDYFLDWLSDVVDFVDEWVTKDE